MGTPKSADVVIVGAGLAGPISQLDEADRFLARVQKRTLRRRTLRYDIVR